LRKITALYRPVVVVLSCALLACCLIAAAGGIKYLTLSVFVALAAAVGSLIALRRARKETNRFIEETGDAISAIQSENLRSFPLAIIAARDGEIVWYNDRAKEDVFGDNDWYSRQVVELFGEEKPTSKTFEFEFELARYTVYPVCDRKDDQMLVLYYLVDDTMLKDLADEYEKTRPAIFMISVDNYDELLQYGRENDRSRLLSEIEYRIENFTEVNNGILIKTGRGRYVALLEERVMDSIIENKFSILDDVRSLSDNNDNLSVSLSIGVARHCANYPEGANVARQSLDMAQGRGGDQAAVKTRSGYDFYGGVSKGIERRTKVKTRIIATAMRELIVSSDLVVIMGHRYADYDAFGAAVGLLRAVRQMGRAGIVAMARSRNLVGPLLDRMEESGYENSFYNPSEAIEFLKHASNPLCIIVDTHLESVLEDAEIYRMCKNVVVIDHHRRMVGYIDNGVIFYHEPYASSASEMVTELIQYFGGDVTIGKAEAEALLAGIMLDTKNFVIRTGVRTFEAAAYLRKQGADTVEVRKLFSSSIEDYQERTKLVSSAEVYNRCAIAQTDSENGDIRVIAAQAADELLSISDVDASFVLFEVGDGVSISARSMGRLNVQVVMESLGGGGHQTMAAAQLENISLPNARYKLLEAIEAHTTVS